MEPILGAAAAAADTANLIKNGSTATFMADVIDASHDAAVIVDFWAPWCGPCKQLGPALEKAVREARGAVRLVKINIDENPELAQQMRIQSIPAVYAFRDGRPVDGFVGALPESQVKQFVGRLSAGAAAGPSPIEEALALAQEAVSAGDAARAANIYSQILQHEPGNAPATAGLARIAIGRKDFAKARQLLDRVPKENAGHADIAAARAALELAEAGSKAQGAVGELRRRIERDANDHEARYELAGALFASGERAQAVDELLELVKRDRKWNDEAARKQLVKFFEALGHSDPLTVAARKRLSSILFS
ncbi:MAG TPA: thioredoxin [Stellaceae bacterium]|jgi:putative thioredoxin|nr:thioredoxin [Stellaceae bacterium]